MRPQEAAARDVSREVAAEGEQAVLGRHHRLVRPPLALRNDAVLVEVDEVEVLAARGVRLRLRDAAVLVGILRREPLGVARQLQVLARLVERAAVADDEDAAAVEHGARLHLGRQAVREPGDFARAEVVRVEPEGARQHDQLACPRPLEQDRRRVPRERARGAPRASARGRSWRRTRRRRSPSTGRTRAPPARRPGSARRPCRRRCRTGRAACATARGPRDRRRRGRSRRRTPPRARRRPPGSREAGPLRRSSCSRRARGTSRRHSSRPSLFRRQMQQQPLALVAREVEALAQQHGRGVAGGHGHAPDGLVGSERARQRPTVRDAVAVRAAEAGPVGGAERGRAGHGARARRASASRGHSRGRLSA